MIVLTHLFRARYFADWIKRDAFGANAKTFVCEIWARDRDLFTSVNKVRRVATIHRFKVIDQLISGVGTRRWKHDD